MTSRALTIALGLCGVPLGLPVALVAALLFGVRTSASSNVAKRVSGIYPTFVTASGYALVFAVVGLVDLGAFLVIFSHQSNPAYSGVVLTLLLSSLSISATLGFLLFGGVSIIHHLTLRALLALSGRLPWNATAFFDWCANHHLLKRQGQAYDFVHPLFQEYWCQAGANSNKDL